MDVFGADAAQASWRWIPSPKKLDHHGIGFAVDIDPFGVAKRLSGILLEQAPLQNLVKGEDVVRTWLIESQYEIDVDGSLVRLDVLWDQQIRNKASGEDGAWVRLKDPGNLSQGDPRSLDRTRGNIVPQFHLGSMTDSNRCSAASWPRPGSCRRSR